MRLLVVHCKGKKRELVGSTIKSEIKTFFFRKIFFSSFEVEWHLWGQRGEKQSEGEALTAKCTTPPRGIQDMASLEEEDHIMSLRKTGSMVRAASTTLHSNRV